MSSDTGNSEATRPEEAPESDSAPQDLPPPPQTLQVKFTGAGRTYFVVWLVNLLLTVLSLGLFWPFAQARKQVFFHQHTLVGGHALSFDANPWTQFQTHLLLIGLCLLNGLVYLFKPELLWLPALLLALLWPALWQASLVFRFSHTQWQGVNLGFAGTVTQAYGVMLPLCLPALFGVLLMSLNIFPSWAQLSQTQTLLGPLGVMLLGMVLVFPWQLLRLHAYVRGACIFASERSHLDPFALAKPVYLLHLKMLAMALLMLAAFSAVAAALARAGLNTGLAASLTLSCLAFPLVLHPYFKAHMQNLLWGRTASAHISFRSTLSYRQLFWLNLQNCVLVVLTLGLYWPIAVVKNTRLKMAAMSVLMQGELDSWPALTSPPAGSLQPADDPSVQVGALS
jgi:uncharacterized membrane protein YjgN (DUF898 family)